MSMRSYLEELKQHMVQVGGDIRYGDCLVPGISCNRINKKKPWVSIMPMHVVQTSTICNLSKEKHQHIRDREGDREIGYKSTSVKARPKHVSGQQLTINLSHLKLRSSQVVLFTEHLGALKGICGTEQARNVRIGSRHWNKSFSVVTQTFDEAGGSLVLAPAYPG